MNRREFAAAVIAATSTGSLSGAQATAAARRMRTQWTVRQSEGFDALYFMGPLSGDPYLAPNYKAELAAFRPRLPPSVIEFLEAGRRQTEAQGAVLSAVLAKFFSMGPDDSIDALIGSLDAAETLLKPKLQASDDWGGDKYWSVMMGVRPPLKVALISMRDAGFANFRNDLYRDTFLRRSQALSATLSSLDVVPQIERLTGLPREPGVEIVMNYFDYPRSQRLFGQRFVTHHSYSDQTIFWIAGHELLHPPFDRKGAAFASVLEVLGRNPFVTNLITRRDPGVGSKGDLPGYVEECCTQALDHLVSARLGLSRDAKKDWGEGEHNSDILAACFYGLLLQDGYGHRGGNFDQWLARAVKAGRLNPGPLSAAGKAVLGASPESLWRPFKEA